MTVTNRWYASMLGRLLAGQVDLTSDDLLLVLVDDSFVRDDSDEVLDDIDPARRIGDPAPVLGTITSTAGQLTSDVTVHLFDDVAVDPDEVAGLLVVVDGATDADRYLVASYLRQADTTPIVVETNGGDIEVEFLDGVLLRLHP